MNIITNLKQITCDVQGDLTKLHQFAENVFESHNIDKDEKLEPKDYFNDVGTYCFYQIPEQMDTNLPISMGAVLKALSGTDIIKKTGEMVKTYKRQFTPEEHEMNCSQLAGFIKEGNGIDDEQKEVMSHFKSRKDANKTSVNLYANHVSNGYQMKDERCTLHLDFERKKRVFISVGSGLTIVEEELQAEDLQLLIELK